MSSDQVLATELGRLDACAQADLVRDRHVTRRELVEAAIIRIQGGNAALNAVVHDRFDAAVEDIQGGTYDEHAPFAGVPFLLKNIRATQAGVPQTRGNIVLKQMCHTPTVDTPLGKRFRESGLVTIGVSNTPEFGYSGDTQPRAYGPTRNPWSHAYSPSGSSGGAAAAVAAGFVPVAHATDSGGSIRQPAAWCGVFGLKPSRGLMPRAIEDSDDLWGAELVVSRSVRDTAALLDAVAGALPGDPARLTKGSGTYKSQLEMLRPLRIGLCLEGPDSAALDPQCAQAVLEAGRVLEEAGHFVANAYPRALLENVPDSVTQTLYHDGFIKVVEELAAIIGRPVTPEDVEPYTWWWYEASRPVSAAALRAARDWHLGRANRLLRWWEEGFDILVAPVTGKLTDRLDTLRCPDPVRSQSPEPPVRDLPRAIQRLGSTGCSISNALDLREPSSRRSVGGGAWAGRRRTPGREVARAGDPMG